MDKFLNFFGLGKNLNKSNQSQSKENSIFPKFDYEMDFLKALNKTSTDKLFGLNTYWEGRYTELLGNLNPIIANFLSKGLLEKSLIEEALTIKELKDILKKNALALSGNKEELAMRVFKEVKNKDYRKGLHSHYKLTSSGEAKVLEYKKEFEEKLGLFFIHQTEVFLNGNLKEFESNHFLLKNSNPDQRSIGASFSSFTEKTVSALNHLKNKKESRAIWNFSNESKNKLRAAIAHRTVNFSNNSFFLKRLFSEEEILKIKESLNLPEISNPEALEMLINFESNYLWNLFTLAELKQIPKKQSRMSKVKGVQILNDGCVCQEKFGTEKYFWNQLKVIPVLPRHLNCQCLYNGFFEE